MADRNCPTRSDGNYKLCEHYRPYGKCACGKAGALASFADRLGVDQVFSGFRHPSRLQSIPLVEEKPRPIWGNRRRALPTLEFEGNHYAPGDVLPSGDVVAIYGREVYPLGKGGFLTTPEKAEPALAHGWRIVRQIPAWGENEPLVEIER